MRTPRQLPGKQKGIVLFISLIVLVAMTLAGIAMTRSVDTGNVISGNVAFKQATLASADRGIQAAMSWLLTGNNSGNLISDIPSSGYFSSNATHPNWSEPSVWDEAVEVPDSSGDSPDAAGNKVMYIIHRLCQDPNTGPNENCAQASQNSSSAQGSDMGVGSQPMTPPPAIYYRISVRVEGPRETLSIVQANVEIR